MEKESKKGVGGDLPHNLEAEQALLGCLLLDQKLQNDIFTSLTEDDFYSESHKYIFTAMARLINDNKIIDLITLSDELERSGTLDSAGGIEYLSELTEFMPSTANYMEYLNVVQRDSTFRRLIKGSSDIIQNCRTSKDRVDALSFAEKTVYDISNSIDTSKVEKISVIIPDVMMKMDMVSRDKTALRGIRTKYKGLDNILDGLHKSDLIILAARPGTGKTSFAMNIVGNVALQGHSCAVFSLEMSKEQIVQRLLCSVANVNMAHASRGEMNQEEWTKIARAKEQLADAKIFINDSALITPQEVLSQCRRLKRKHGLDLVMVDYIQLMNAPGNKNMENRQREITEISRGLKMLAKELDVPVLALSQLNRSVESRKGRPQLSDLRESGAIEQDADIVIFIHRPDKEKDSEKDVESGKIKKNVAQIIVEKHRNGAQGIIELYFEGSYTKFLNLDPETGEPEDIGGAAKVTPAPAAEESEEDNPDSEVF